MRLLKLKEYDTERNVPLSLVERRALSDPALFITLTPSNNLEGCFDLKPGSWIGTLHLPTLDVVIRPKIAIPRVLFLLSYALDPARWKDIPFDYGEADSLLEAVIPGYVAQVRRALCGGVLQGYRTVEESLTTVRGRLRFEDQIRSRFGKFPPVEVRYDEYTEDITENRLIKAALYRLQQMPVRSHPVRQSLRAFDALMANVTSVPYHPHHVPAVSYTRLNERYRPAVELSRLILKSISLDMYSGTRASSTFLVDMNKVFEDFVVVALREKLKVSSKILAQGASRQSVHLDEARIIKLKPDLSWWDGPDCTFVGDVKYKHLSRSEINNPDVYQMLAYTVAAKLPGGLLIYASGGEALTTHRVVHIGKEIHICVLDIEKPPKEVLEQIQNLAKRTTLLRNAVLTSLSQDKLTQAHQKITKNQAQNTPEQAKSSNLLPADSV